ncbi:3-isopropylmalate dehydratase large subunit [Rhizoctonia solani]|uniref:3-isopropylmalate dehydratase n=1 Tax=Rhizoctonia solani TaxID=456999 RepID=A0A8H7IIB0_9AGAM|nr:3-isopropylmalate dehydratase large subunit [Rhizoctonia solani]
MRPRLFLAGGKARINIQLLSAPLVPFIFLSCIHIHDLVLIVLRPRLVQDASAVLPPRTLYDKIWDDHVVHAQEDGTTLLYIDRHLVHEVTSPQAFEDFRRPDCTLATVDHNVPTSSRKNMTSVQEFIAEPDSRAQCVALEENVREFGLTYFGMKDRRQGSCILLDRNKGLLVNGTLAPGVTSKDVILHIIGLIGTAVVPLRHRVCGDVFRGFSMEARMSVCNMSIEAGARAGMVAPDEVTFEYLKGRPLAPRQGPEWDCAEAYWRTLKTDEDAKFDVEQTRSSQGHGARSRVHGLEANTKMEDVKVDKVFLGSCTNGRIEDLRSAADVVLAAGPGAQVAPGVVAMIVPGSGLVKQQAEAEDSTRIYSGRVRLARGRLFHVSRNEPGPALAGRTLREHEQSEFRGPAGRWRRTHLVSPAMAAAAAMTGHLTDTTCPPPNPIAPVDAASGDVPKTAAPVNQFTVVKVSRPAGHGECRHGYDYPEAVLEDAQAHGLGKALFHTLRVDPKRRPDRLFFAEIFKTNSMQNGLLPVVLSPEACQLLYNDAQAQLELEVDLISSRFCSVAERVQQWNHSKHCLLNGLDDIGITLQKGAAIEAFEERRSSTWPWLDGFGYAKGGGRVDAPAVKARGRRWTGPLLERQTTDQLLEYYYEEQPVPRTTRPSKQDTINRSLHVVELDMDTHSPDLGRRFQPSRVALVAPDTAARTSDDARHPPGPPAPLHPHDHPDSTATETARLAPAPIVRGNSDYSIVAVSDSSTERVTHARNLQSPAGPRTDEKVRSQRTRPLGSLDEDDPDEGSTRPTRSGTITSRSTRTHTTTPSVTSVHTPSSNSHYTQSSKSHYTNPSRDASEEMLDLIATVGSALSDMSLDPPRQTMTDPRQQPNRRPTPPIRVSPTTITPSANSDLRPEPFPRAGSEHATASDATRSPEKHRLRDLSPEKPGIVARDSSPEKPRPREVSPGSGSGSGAVRAALGRSWVVQHAVPVPIHETVPALGRPSLEPLTTRRSPEKPRQSSNVPLITRSSYEQHSDLSSPRSAHSPRSPRLPTSPRSTQTTTDHLKFRQPGSALPESFYFAEVLKMKTSSERTQGYVRKINQLAAEDSGLAYWVGFMKGRVKPGPDPPNTSNPTSPSAQHSTFGPHGPGTRRQQPRHVSGGSVGSEVTFAVRPDAYVATNISVRSSSPPLSGAPPPSLPYPSLAKDIGIRSAEPRTNAAPTPGMKAKVGSIGLFSHIGRKASVRRGGTDCSGAPAYGELPVGKPVTLSAPPTIPGGPRARPDKRGLGGVGGERGGTDDGASDSGHSYAHTTLHPHPRASVIMIGGRDSFQTMSPSGDGRPVSIRVPSSNGHGVVTPNLPPLSPSQSGGMRSPEPHLSSYRDREGSVYSRDSYRDRGSRASSAMGYANGGGSVIGHGGGGGGGGGGNIEQLMDVFPHVDRTVLQGYLDRAGGHEIDAISAYLEDERRMNGSVGHEYG